MLLNYNELVSGGYFVSDVDNSAFSLEFKELCKEFKGLPVVLNEIETKGITVDGKKVYFKFDDNEVLSYLRYCINFIEAGSIIDFLDFRDYVDYWCEESPNYNYFYYRGFHAIKFDNYAECIKFYSVVYYIVALYLGL